MTDKANRLSPAVYHLSLSLPPQISQKARRTSTDPTHPQNPRPNSPFSPSYSSKRNSASWIYERLKEKAEDDTKIWCSDSASRLYPFQTVERYVTESVRRGGALDRAAIQAGGMHGHGRIVGPKVRPVDGDT